MPETPATPDTPGSTTPSRAHGLAIVRWLLIVAAVFAVLAAAMSWISRSVTIASPVSESSTVKALLADFRLASLEGGPLGPPDFPGQVVVIDFWATWCGPCRLQARYLEQLHAELEGKPVQFLAIDVGEDEATVRKYLDETPFPYPVLLDPDDSLGSRYEIYGLPTVMIVDRGGAVSFLETGISDTATLRQAVAAAGLDL